MEQKLIRSCAVRGSFRNSCVDGEWMNLTLSTNWTVYGSAGKGEHRFKRERNDPEIYYLLHIHTKRKHKMKLFCICLLFLIQS